jgi:hypothetical protein
LRTAALPPSTRFGTISAAKGAIYVISPIVFSPA